MRQRLFSFTIILLFSIVSLAQTTSEFIIADQFGYLPDAKKIAVLKEPQTGFDAGESYAPGQYLSLVNAMTGEKIYRASRTIWGNGATDASSGDKAWHFDFTEVTNPGTYYILDESNNLKSCEFVISHNVYNEILKQAMRSFFYQRAGFKKEAKYAGEGWADSASHIGNLQDKNCRSFFDKDNAESEKDVSGGWYDAGDYNKYTNWTANYVVEMMKAYMEKPNAWADDYNIPESGNGIPDIMDEAKWGIDHLLRLQQGNGSVLCIVAESHASPPSTAGGPSYYGPASTSATLNSAAAFAICSKVYRELNQVDYADTLVARAIKAWDWAEENPAVIFNNNDGSFNSIGLGAGNQEVDDYDRGMIKLEAACYLFEATGEEKYRNYFDKNYMNCHLIEWTFAYPFEPVNQEVLLYYTTLDGGTISVQDKIRSVYKNAIVNGSDNLVAYKNKKDPYLAYIKDYTWGSNSTKASQGNMFYDLITYQIDENSDNIAKDAALSFVNYLHGVNPLNFVYLSNMYNYGAENGVNEFYHSWFSNNSPLWDRVGKSTYGPPPGYLTGGPNPGYNWDGCCPSGCGSSSNNSICTSESIAPPKNQPAQKSYKDFNTSWPLNSWSVTENSCGYQVNYIRLLSKFVTAGFDCYGDKNGTAYFDSCGVCAGGNTGITPGTDKNECSSAPENPDAVTMYVEGRHIYTAAGEKVVLRGVNEMFVWSDDKTGKLTLPEIAKTGSNCVRLVWTEEYGNKQNLVELIENCIANKMIAIPECHSATGEWDKLGVCINFWKDPVLIDGIQKNKKWTLLNVGNEVGDGTITDLQFKTGYMAAIDSLRTWGYTVPLVIDASTWGQDVDIIFNNWKEILEHDPLKNIIFSVHSYWSTTDNYNLVANESINEGIPIIIGEGPSPTAYPDCHILDFETGLDIAGENDIGWLSWSWGAVNNGDCVPNFDHTSDGQFGNWETVYASIMMVDHEFSLMRTANRPSSFFDHDTIPVSGIYISPAISSLNVGDTITVETVITPVNAAIKEFSIEISGNTDAVSYDKNTGILIVQASGEITLKAVSHDKDSSTFSRIIELREIPVTNITVLPSQADMFINDTIYLEVAVLPENATVKDYTFEVTDEFSVIEFDESTGMVVAKNAGTAEIKARWVNGNVEGVMSITVIDQTGTGLLKEGGIFNIYPNPNGGLLQITCNGQWPFNFFIFDISGRLVFEGSYSGTTTVDTRLLIPGYYEALIKRRDEVFRQKLIKL